MVVALVLVLVVKAVLLAMVVAVLKRSRACRLFGRHGTKQGKPSVASYSLTKVFQFLVIWSTFGSLRFLHETCRLLDLPGAETFLCMQHATVIKVGSSLATRIDVVQCPHGVPL